MAGAALGGNRPVFSPKYPTKHPGRGGPSWEFVVGPVLLTDDDHNQIILTDDTVSDIVP